MLRWNTQMGGSPCVFNVKKIHSLVMQKKKYDLIFVCQRHSRDIDSTIQVMTGGSTDAEIVTPLAINLQDI